MLKLGDTNVSDINLSTSNLVVGKSIINQSTEWYWCSFDLSASGISSAFFDAFDEERYSIHYANGTIEDINIRSICIK